eukprot:9129323-Alexandrium_andersonii.AAC.1
MMLAAMSATMLAASSEAVPTNSTPKATGQDPTPPAHFLVSGASPSAGTLSPRRRPRYRALMQRNWLRTELFARGRIPIPW